MYVMYFDIIVSQEHIHTENHATPPPQRHSPTNTDATTNARCATSGGGVGHGGDGEKDDVRSGGRARRCCE